MFTNLLPSYFIASTTEIMTDLLASLHSYIILIIGVLLAITALAILISHFFHK